MRRLFLVAALLFAAHCAHAATCPLASGGNVQTALNTCGSGNTVALAAGTYTISSTVTVPCGVSLVGPTPASVGGSQPFYSQTPNQTAKLNSTMAFENYGFELSTGCSVPQTFQYLEWNGGFYGGNGTVVLDGESPPNAISGSFNPSGGSGCQTQNHTNVSCGNGGGNFIYMPAGVQNVTITNNYIHGANCGFLCGDRHASLIYADSPGGQSTPGGSTPAFPSGYKQTNNITITWNIFGATGDCYQAVVWQYNQNTEGGGGTCNGVSSQAGMNNFIVNNNRFTDEDDELKYYELATNSGPPATGSAGFCNGCFFNYNHFQRFDRIGEEMQINWGGSGEPTLVYSQYSDYSNHLNPMQQDYDISMANGCIYNFNSANQLYCENHVDYNFTVADGGPVTGANVGYEYWGGNGSSSSIRASTGNGNVWVGNQAAVSFQWDPSGNYIYNNNTMMSPINGGNACNSGCTLQNGQSNPEYAGCPSNPSGNGQPNFKPSCSGNYSQTSNGTITSVTPSLSVSGGTITITNNNVSTPNGSAAPTGRDSNTTFWCTSNGNTPSIGNTANNGTAAYWAGTASATVASVTPGGSGTFKCIGMWGAPNQPYSYLAVGSGGGGYIPSAMVSVAFSGGGGGAASQPTFLPVAGSYVGSQSVAISSTSPGAILCWNTTGSPATNGTTGCSTGTLYTGPVSVVTSQTLYAVAGGTGYTDSTVGSAAYVITSPSVQPGFISGKTQFNLGVQ